jgi:hypothetical protein
VILETFRADRWPGFPTPGQAPLRSPFGTPEMCAVLSTPGSADGPSGTSAAGCSSAVDVVRPPAVSDGDGALGVGVLDPTGRTSDAHAVAVGGVVLPRLGPFRRVPS